MQQNDRSLVHFGTIFLTLLQCSSFILFTVLVTKFLKSLSKSVLACTFFLSRSTTRGEFFKIGILLFQPEAGGDGTKQNSLLNFVMAFHTTSMRAKEALRSFRRRTEASRQEREASGVTPPRAVEPSTVKTDSLTESTSEDKTNDVPEVVVSGSEGEKDTTNTQEETDEGEAEQEEQVAPEDNPSASPDSDEIKESSEHESEGGEFESEEDSVQPT